MNSILFTTLFLLTEAALASCGSDNFKGLKVKWCIEKGSGSQDVLYYLHRAGGSERYWNSHDLKNIWSSKNRPTVISISLGEKWLLNNDNQFKTLNLVLREVFPALESKTKFRKGISRINRRFLLGESMGGFNAVQLVFEDPTYFSRVALICPMVSTLSPYSTSEELDAFIKGNQPFIRPELVTWYVDTTKAEFKSPESWERYSPLKLANKNQRALAELYVLGNGSDEFGFFASTENFVNSVRPKAKTLQWVEIPNSFHCTYTTESLQALDTFFTL